MRKITAIVLLAAIWTPIDPAEAHDWFSLQCCSGMDCREIPASAVTAAKGGYRIDGNPHVVPYSSPRVKQSPPQAGGAYGLCTVGGKPDGAVICLYVPGMGS